MNEELEVLKIVCRRLKGADIPYMVTGSTAANFYTMPRMTRDIDIVIEMKKEDVSRFSALFKDDFYVDAESVGEAIAQRGMFNIIHQNYVLKIDFIIRKESPYRKLEFDRRQQVPSEGIEISVVGIEDLILSKLFWAKDSFSEIQLKDIENLLAANKKIDFSYLQKWIQSLGLEDVYQKVKS